MKKLMIAAAIVCAAAMAQAGTVSWSLSGIVGPNGTALTSGYVYTFSSQEGTYKTQADLKTALGNAATPEAFLAVLTDTTGPQPIKFYESALSGALTSSGTFASGSVDVANLTMITPGKTATQLFALIVDSADGSISADTKWVVTGLSTPPKPIPAVAAVTSQGYSLAAGTSTAGANWKNIPEPTSGLLMLLGVAGLALKRKRA